MKTFNKIERNLAIQFSILVSLLILVCGAIYIYSDYLSVNYQTDRFLERDSTRILARIGSPLENLQNVPSERDRSRIRILDTEGGVIYSGEIFNDFAQSISLREFETVYFEGQSYRILTRPIIQSGQNIGILQLAEVEKVGSEDLTGKIGLLCAVIVAISFVTYLFGRFFAKRSLTPVHETLGRLEQFTQDASHELRTPLAIIGSSLDLAIKTENYKEGILSAKENLNRAAFLIESLLNVARLDKFAIELKPVDFSLALTQAIERYNQFAVQKMLKINTNIKTGVIVQGDKLVLSQLLGNLIDNAIKFNIPGGTIDIELQNDHFRIQNTGTVIKPEHLSKIYDPFFQADSSRSQEGFGLGLSIVKKTVGLHGWKIFVTSNQNSGTAFLIKFR
jgi:signal transduction histidine kinase